MSPEAKREYQKTLMRKRRGQAPAQETNSISEEGMAVPNLKTDLGGEHYWGWISHAPDGMRICEAFEFGSRWIGGCGQVVPWEGKPLPTKVDGSQELAPAIIDSPYFKEIQSAMPLSPRRAQS
jgi:hypothetical protein